MIIDVSGADLLLADIRVRAGQAAGDRVQHYAGRVLVRMFRCCDGNPYYLSPQVGAHHDDHRGLRRHRPRVPAGQGDQ